MTTYFLVGAHVLALVAGLAADGLTIEHAVKISFPTQKDRFYQVEASANPAAEGWSFIGPIHHGNGGNLSETAVTSSAASLIFRTREYNLTNGLLAHYPMNGNGVDTTGNSAAMTTQLIYTTNRLGLSGGAALLYYGGYGATPNPSVNVRRATMEFRPRY